MTGERDAFRKAQAHQHHFVALLHRCDLFSRFEALPFALHAIEPFTRHPESTGRKADAIRGDAAMRAGTYTRIVAIAPIDEIVPRLRAGNGIVRYFVGG